MPNGGIDNCGTCWFNRKNKGKAGHDHANDEGEHFCLIRDLPITGDAFHTYCANSPYNTPEKIDVPIGGVYVAAVPGYQYQRVLWQPSPDSEELRLLLLELLATVEEWPEDFPGNSPWDDMLIWQLGEFREARAVEELKRIAAFDPTLKRQVRTRKQTVDLAKEALDKIAGT